VLTEPLRFWVPGLPAPKGSPQVVTKGKGGVPLPFPRVVADTKATKQWQSAVATSSLYAMRGRKLWSGDSCCLVAVFAFESPATRYGTGRNAGELKPSARVAVCVKPDVDKLVRTTLDGMCGIVFDDDSRVVCASAWKTYAPKGQPIGASIYVGALDLEQLRDVSTSYLETVWAAQPGLRSPCLSTQQPELEL
jgi:hypothetical protein